MNSAGSLLSVQELHARLRRVERQNRALAAFVALAGLGVGALLLMGAEPEAGQPKKIEAEAFVLRDANGRVRATLSSLDGGGAALVFFDSKKQSNLRLIVGVNADGIPSLQLNDARGTERAVFGLDDADAPGIDLSDRAGRRRVRLNVADRGGEQPASLSLWDEKGHARVSAIFSPSIMGFFLSGPGDETRSVMGMSADGTPVNFMTGPDGKTIWSAP